MIIRYVDSLDPGNVPGLRCLFAASTNSSGSATYYQETENIAGSVGAVVTLQVTSYTNTNTAGQVLVNSSQVYLNSTFNVTLDGAGNGNFLARVQGDASQTDTVVSATFTITGVSIGPIGSPSNKQISKTF